MNSIVSVAAEIPDAIEQVQKIVFRGFRKSSKSRIVAGSYGRFQHLSLRTIAVGRIPNGGRDRPITAPYDPRKQVPEALVEIVPSVGNLADRRHIRCKRDLNFNVSRHADDGLQGLLIFGVGHAILPI